MNTYSLFQREVSGELDTLPTQPLKIAVLLHDFALYNRLSGTSVVFFLVFTTRIKMLVDMLLSEVLPLLGR